MAGPRGCLVVFACVFAVAGCLGGDDAGDGPGAIQSGPGPAAFDVDNDLDGCVVAAALFLVDPDSAQRLVPDAYQVADASGLFGLPLPSGRAVIFVDTFTCSASSLSEAPLDAVDLGVYVEPPSVPGLRSETGTFHIYGVAHVTSSADHMALLRSAGYRVVEARTEVALTVPPAGFHVGSEVIDADGRMYAHELTGPSVVPLGGVSRYWHESPSGLAFFEYAFPQQPNHVGVVVSCSIRPDSVIHEALGTEDCTGSDTATLTVVDGTYAGRIAFLPGVHAEAP